MTRTMTAQDYIARAQQVARDNKLPQEDIRGEVVCVYIPHIFGKMSKDEKAVIIREMQDTGVFWLSAWNPDEFGDVLMPLAG